MSLKEIFGLSSEPKGTACAGKEVSDGWFEFDDGDRVNLWACSIAYILCDKAASVMSRYGKLETSSQRIDCLGLTSIYLLGVSLCMTAYFDPSSKNVKKYLLNIGKHAVFSSVALAASVVATRVVLEFILEINFQSNGAVEKLLERAFFPPKKQPYFGWVQRFW